MSDPKRILVCGARDYTDAKKIHTELSNLLHAYGPFILIEGEARGADRIARNWGDRHLPRMNIKPFPANWKRFGRGAGPIRNRQMLELGKPDIVLAFGGKDGTGTNNMVKIAKRAGVFVREYDRD